MQEENLSPEITEDGTPFESKLTGEQIDEALRSKGFYVAKNFLVAFLESDMHRSTRSQREKYDRDTAKYTAEKLLRIKEVFFNTDW